MIVRRGERSQRHRKHTAAYERRAVEFTVRSMDDAGRFSGYASVFGVVDSYDEIVAPGAFADSLQRIRERTGRGQPLPALWQHRSAEPVGGYDVLEEDETGLRVGGFLLRDSIERAREAYALMRSGVVSGLSIGYYVPEGGASFDESTGIRTLLKVDLVEISIVTFPANDAARVDVVKEKIGRGERLNEHELAELLRSQGIDPPQLQRHASVSRHPARTATACAQLARIELPAFIP